MEKIRKYSANITNKSLIRNIVDLYTKQNCDIDYLCDYAINLTNGRCAYCGKELINEEGVVVANYSFDHFYPASLGNPLAKGNIVLSCDMCNYKKGDKNALDFYYTLDNTYYNENDFIEFYNNNTNIYKSGEHGKCFNALNISDSEILTYRLINIYLSKIDFTIDENVRNYTSSINKDFWEKILNIRPNNKKEINCINSIIVQRFGDEKIEDIPEEYLKELFKQDKDNINIYKIILEELGYDTSFEINKDFWNNIKKTPTINYFRHEVENKELNVDDIDKELFLEILDGKDYKDIKYLSEKLNIQYSKNDDFWKDIENSEYIKDYIDSKIEDITAIDRYKYLEIIKNIQEIVDPEFNIASSEFDKVLKDVDEKLNIDIYKDYVYKRILNNYKWRNSTKYKYKLETDKVFEYLYRNMNSIELMEDRHMVYGFLSQIKNVNSYIKPISNYIFEILHIENRF